MEDEDYCDCDGYGPVRGALWPHGSEGWEPRFPYVERHDICEVFENDMQAAEAVRDHVGGLLVLCPMDPFMDDPMRLQPAVYPWPEQNPA